MPSSIGWDVGGANIKACLVKLENDGFHIRSIKEYFPIWRKGKENLSLKIREIHDRIAGKLDIDVIGLTMTAELSDIYFTKREGIEHIINCMESIYGNEKIKVVSNDLNIFSADEARKKPNKVAASNWAATGWLLSRIMNTCIGVDVGSTTCSIIPIVNRICRAEGMNDLEKLINGELIYTGVLRTNVATIISKVPVRGRYARVSSELFALTGDVHLVLNNIKEEDYTTETADGRGKTRTECLARIARIVCADVDMLSERDIINIAKYIYDKQIEQIAEGIHQVYTRIIEECVEEPPILTMGLGEKILARKAAERLGLSRIVCLSDIFGREISIATPSAAVALIALNTIKPVTSVINSIKQQLSRILGS
ncbi:MAG: hydantoinase/oxoprolinase family protein [Candidatus Methanomethylicia archaeon]